MSFFSELRRRNVFKIGIAYAIVAWLLIQVASILFPTFNSPDWVMRVFTAVVIFGFPIALIITWAFELTPEGIKRTEPTSGKPAPPPAANADTLPKAKDSRSVAVLPFVNMSSDPEQEYFSDGLSEELLNQLAQIDELKVIGRTSSFAFKGRNVDLREIGEQLGAAHLLEGSVRKSGERLRITAQLIDAANGHHLWSDTYDRRLDDVFAIQDEIAHSVADALSVTLGVGRNMLETDRTEDVQTYDLYLRGRAFFNRSSAVDLERAMTLYRQALSRDPDFSRARAGLVHTSLYSIIYNPERRTEAVKTIEQVVADARVRSPDDWATYLAVAMLHMVRFEWVAAESAFVHATARSPASVPEGDEVKSLLLIDLGRVEDAVTDLKASMSNDPLSATRSFQVQFALSMLGRNEEAELEYQRSLDLPGTDAREDIHHSALSRVWHGNDAALIEQRFDAFLSRQTIATPWIVEVRKVYDDPDAALAIIHAALDDPANQDPTRLQFVAAYASHYGDTELALAAARRALVDMRGQNIAILWWYDMAATRRLPGFKDLVREIGLVDYWRKTGNWGDFCRPLGKDDFEFV